MNAISFLAQNTESRVRRFIRKSEIRRLVGKLQQRPLDPELHFRLGKLLLRAHDWPLAAAELRSATTLGKGIDAVGPWLERAQARLPPLTRLEHNQYYRFESLAREISRHGEPAGASVLDVGGGKGYLAQFLPRTDYCLAEPTVNGISGVDLPFTENSFDYVVSCHVLEHVPPGERFTFLDRLCATAKQAVVLLNPFHLAGTSVSERLEFLLRVTGADWAREHLECGLPYLADIEKFAQQRGIRCKIRPNGSVATSTALVLLEHFAKKSLRIAEFERVSEFFNSQMIDCSTSEQFPNAYLVRFDL